MFLLDSTVVTSPSDLTTAAKCEFAFVRQLDAKLGLIEIERAPRDPLEARAAELGDEHENRWLEHYRANHKVVEIARTGIRAEELREAARLTEQAFRDNAEVVFQATFFDESDPAAPMIGFADFIVRQPDGRYRVQDTKLARSVKVPALLQLAAYYDQLVRLGIPADDTVELILGTDEIVPQNVHDILPVYRKRRERLHAIVRERAAATEAAQWGDHRYAIDGRCEFCEPEVEASRDLLLVAGMRPTQRTKLLAAGIRTIDELATATKPEGMTGAFESLKQQAALQVTATPDEPPPFVMFAPELIGDLPVPDPGDIFFDFEGDPLYREEATWGLDYLWGLVDRNEQFTAFWAHDFEAEKVALEEFLAWVGERRARYPGMHIYHYASYERTHLLTISARHGIGEHEVDNLLRDTVLVDLYPLVKKTVRVGGRSYSIKKLEPLYMGTELRESEVEDAAASIEQYDQAMRAEAAEQERLLETIADYNRYDCVSTLRLHEWLLARASEHGVQPGMDTEQLEERAPFEPSILAGQLLGLDDGSGAFALASAAVDYHRRENKSFWWEHYARLEYPVEEWQDQRGIFMVTSGEIVSDWHLKSTVSYRTVRLRGEWAPGSSVPRDAFTLYDPPGPYRDPHIARGMRLPVGVDEIRVDENDPDIVYVTEKCPGYADPWARMPLAIAPGRPLRTQSIERAIETVGARLCETPWPKSAIGDILRRTPARTRSGTLAPEIIDSILDLDDSYLAVQGPPGTGKTTLAAKVITTLVRDHGWRIGVVAQSHKVVENVLHAVIKAGLDPAKVGKSKVDDAPFTMLPDDGHHNFAARNTDGYVIGGTAWDLTNTKRIGRRQLDLLVIDEAGQFSLAATMAVSVAASNLLLLGDPQQLPQVSQGTHPAPVDQSALGYIADGHAVLPTEYGYFLPESWRMHSALTAPVSDLAYDGALRSAPSADARMLAGIAPGLHPIPVLHEGNATHSVEEAAVVVDLIRDHLGRDWNGSPLTEDDIIVVTPYNAQVECIREALGGHPGIRVGTVDKFQGQEAAVSIVSMAASSPEDVPRGLDFLLSRNRLNVAISRAQWAAYLLYSPALVDTLPHTPAGVADLSRFIRLVSAG
ncbi:MAG: TM0106 family RecB-like putative nuclease [Salinibacterium sp.]|nr:TM0106 family RecB-like putative nuclease [Salinibacterium sp.]